MSDYCVYKHTSPNAKVYIGITSKNPLKRWRNGKGYENNKHFDSAIVKYGWDNFKHEILYTGLSKEEAEQKEIELIANYNSANQKYGYNISTGGKSGRGYKRSEEHKMKVSKSLKGHKVSKKTRKLISEKVRLNFKNNPDTTLKISNSLKEYYKSNPEIKEKMSLALKGRKAWNKGIPLTDETKKKLSAKANKKSVIQLDKNENYINTYDSILEAERKTGIHNGSIASCCKGKRPTAGGYKWKYVA